MEFTEKEKIIWDSHFGYEIGYFIGPGVTQGTYEVDLETGVIQGKVSHACSEIHKYTPELLEQLKEKYRYDEKYQKYVGKKFKPASQSDTLVIVDYSTMDQCFYTNNGDAWSYGFITDRIRLN